MIDRKALWISGMIFLAMTAAAFWRLSLLADWHHLPLSGPGDPHTVGGLFLFIEPAALLFVMIMLFARKWFVSGPAEAVGPWRRWSSLLLIPYAVFTALIEAIAIARSLGFATGLDRLAIAHAIIIAAGILIMVLGNALPKMPWLSARFRPFQLDPWQWNRHLRFMGRITVFLGLFIAIGGPLLPRDTFMPMLICLWLAGFTMGIVYRIKLRRESSPLP